MSESSRTGSGSPVAVVGAGISGLAAAWSVRQAERPVVVFEAGERVGGVIATEGVDGHLLELGPASLMASADLARLVDEVGLTDARLGPLPGATRRYIVRQGRAVATPATPLGALTTPLLSLRGRLRALGEPFVRPAPASAAEESIAALVRRRFGAELLNALVDPIVSGVYAGDPDRLSSRHALRLLHELERRHGSVVRGALRRVLLGRRGPGGGARSERRSGRRSAMFSFAGGLRRLPDALAQALGSAVRLRTRVVDLRRDAGGWTIVTECDGRSAYHRVGAVVLAAPAPALGTLDAGGELGRLLARIALVPHAPVATLALGFRRADVAHPLDGFGVLMPWREQVDVLGALFPSSVFPGRAPNGQVLLTCFVGGARRPELALEPFERTERRALAVLRPLLGIRGRPTIVHGARWTPGIPQYEIGHDGVLETAELAERRFPGLALAGSWRGGVSLGDCVSCGLAAGERAAVAARAVDKSFEVSVQALRYG